MTQKSIEPSGARDPLAALEQAAVAEEALSVIRHDLRNKIATVRNAVFYMKRRLTGSEVSKKDPRIIQFLDTIDSEVIAADGFVAEGCSAARLARPLPPPASAAECVERACVLARAGGAGVRVVMDLAPGDIAIGPDTLALVVRFLVENAIEASPAGGVVAVRGAPDGPVYRIDVEDEGGGLPKEAGDSIFEAFFSTKPGHMGVGLAIAGRAARRAGGRLSVVPGPTKGAVATLTFPRAHA